MIDINELNAMEEPQLNELIAKLDIAVHHRSGLEKKREAIFLKLTEENKPKAQEPKQPLVAKETPHNTPEEVMAHPDVKRVAEQYPDKFKARFNDSENTWEFSCNGHAECGNLDIPIHKIAQAASRVVHASRLKPRALEGFESLNNLKGKAAYANNVLA